MAGFKDGSVRNSRDKKRERVSYPREDLLLNVARIDGIDRMTQRMLCNLAGGILRVLGQEISSLIEAPNVKKVGRKLYCGLVAIIFGIWEKLEISAERRDYLRERHLLPLKKEKLISHPKITPGEKLI